MEPKNQSLWNVLMPYLAKFSKPYNYDRQSIPEVLKYAQLSIYRKQQINSHLTTIMPWSITKPVTHR